MVEGEFLDTNIVFDAIYTTRPLYQNFHKTFSSVFLLKKLCITISIDTEVQIIATDSVNFLVKELYNTIRPTDWDNLATQKKDELIKAMSKNLEADSEVKRKKRGLFVQDALKAITAQLQSLTKSEIITVLCPNLHYLYTRELQRQIFEHFSIPPVDGSHPDHKNLSDVIKDSNQKCKAFTTKENQDFYILTDLVLLVAIGARWINNMTQDFDSISFYSRDGDFRGNFDKFKEYFNKIDKNTNESSIEEAIGSIVVRKPY